MADAKFLVEISKMLDNTHSALLKYGDRLPTRTVNSVHKNVSPVIFSAHKLKVLVTLKICIS